MDKDLRLRTIGFRVTEPLAAAIEDYCWTHRIRLSDLMRRALAEYLHAHGSAIKLEPVTSDLT